ncbi:MAG: hypothetical protein SWE60_03635 [Thermodesulfobacteriota bacterium]|nr:hypothetical protein [Thermodesulfobacteriota bacterium]
MITKPWENRQGLIKAGLVLDTRGLQPGKETGGTTDMIIVLGARSGTSVLFRCLERTGLHGDSSCYRVKNNDSEHRQFRVINIRLRRSSHPASLIPVAKGLWSDMLNRGVQIIKEPHFVWVWSMWFEAVPDFRTYQYIHMKRAIGDQAHSLLKHQTLQGYKNRSIDKCYRYCQAMEAAIEALLSQTPHHLVVAFDEFVSLRGIGQISAFIGQDLDTSLIDRGQVSRYATG